MAQSTNKLKIGLLGSTGRVGRLLIDEITQSSLADLSVIFVREKLDFALPNHSHLASQNPQNPQNSQDSQKAQNPTIITNDLDTLIKSCEVIIDFSSPNGTASLLQALQQMQKSNHSLPACVIGTTGLSKDIFALLDSLSKHIPILYAANMSLGIAVLRKVIEQVASTLKNADIEISEIHHRFKKDAPSGTALALAHSCAKGRGLNSAKTEKLAQNPNDAFITDRALAGERKDGQISVVSLRGGDVAGRHTVGFYMQGEYLEFTHNATNRATFAKGALECALWLSTQKPNRYGIDDMLI